MEKEILYLMGLLKPIMGIGQFYGNVILRGNSTFIDPLDINAPTGIEIQFYSPSGEFVGMVGTTFDDSNLINWEVEEKKIGGLEKFQFSITRLVDIPFYNQMETRMFINGKYWFSGELQLKPNEDRRNPNYIYEGRGWVSYLKEIKINKLYENKTLEFILKDILENDIAPETPILYNPSLIVPPNYTVTKLEFKKKTAKKAIDTVLEIANIDYTTNQYRYGVNKEKQFFFEEIDDEEIEGYFEGYQYQDPDVKEDLKAVINQIDIYRAQEDSQDVEFVSRVEDTESQGLYGIRNRDITISDFVDTTTAERIANAIIERFKEPITEIKINDLETKEDPYDIGFYLINNKRDDYSTAINEFENVSDWNTTNAPNTSITETQDKVLSGKKAFQIITGSGSNGEFIEYTLDDAFNFPSTMRLYVAQEEEGEYFTLQLEDEDGEVLDIGEAYILAEDGTFILNEEGGFIEQQLSGIDIDLIEDYQDLYFDVSILENIKKIRIIFVTDEAKTIYLDRLDIFSSTYKQNKLTIEKIKYSQEGNTVLAQVIYGEEIDNVINDIKKIGDKQINIINIFQKS
jgi:hypothetical protein